MKYKFWQSRWQNKQTGFHQQETNRSLQKFLSKISSDKKTNSILVPLCGKSKDMLFLRDEGFKVVGVEFVESAVNELFSENKIDFNKTPTKTCIEYVSQDITILCGDFLAMNASSFKRCNKIFDRAALVALPDDMRIAYTKKITELTQSGDQMLLVSFDYDPDMGGPPFRVSKEEVFKLYQKDWQIELLESKDILSENRRFAERGLTTLNEITYWLERK